MSINSLPPISAEDKAMASEKLATPVERVKASGKAKKKSNIIRIVLFIIMLASIITPAVIIYLNNGVVSQKSEETTLAIETTNTEIKELVKEALIYTNSGPATYYSPSLDSSFELDTSIVSASEMKDHVVLYPRTSDNTYGKLYILDTDPLKYIEDEYGTMDKFSIETAEGKTPADAPYVTLKFEYEVAPFLKNEKVKVVKNTVYYKEIDSNLYVYLHFSKSDGTEVPTNISESFNTILTTLIYKPTNVAVEAIAQLTDFDMQVSFDRKEWELTYQTDQSVRFTKYEEEWGKPYVTVAFRGSKIYAFDDKETLIKKNVDYELNYAEENKEGYKLIKEPVQEKLGNVEVTTFSYSFSGISGTSYITGYYGFAPEKDFYFEIFSSVYTEDEDSSGDYAKEHIDKLVQGVSFKSGTKQASAEESDSVLGENTLNIEEPALLGKLSTIHIANTTCATFTINDPLNLPGISGKSIDHCLASFGTGFFITPEGHIVTNAHVASGNPFNGSEDVFLNTDGTMFKSVLQEIARQILISNPYALQTDEEISRLVSITRMYILKLIGEEKIEISNIEYSNYMELDKPFVFDRDTMKLKTPSDYVELELIDANELNSTLEHYGKLVAEEKELADNPYQMEVADLALLKVISPTTSYPTLDLGTGKTLLEGNTLLAIGFPGATDNRSLFSDISSTSATITRGTISAIKDNPTNLFKLIQTDAAINHGNSGGPMLDENAKVIAVSTYLVSAGESDNYGAGISVDEVKNFVSENGVVAKESDISNNILSGINNMQKDYYKWAIRDFDNAIKAYPSSEEVVKPLKLLAQEKIDEGSDNTPIATYGEINIHPTDLPYIFGGLGSAVVMLLILIVLAIKKRPKKVKPTKQIPPADIAAQQPESVVPPMGQQTPPAPSPLPEKPIAEVSSLPVEPKSLTIGSAMNNPKPTVAEPIVTVAPVTMEQQVTPTSPIQPVEPSISLPQIPTETTAPTQVEPLMPQVTLKPPVVTQKEIEPIKSNPELPPMMQTNIPTVQTTQPQQGPQFINGLSNNMATEPAPIKEAAPTLPPLNTPDTTNFSSTQPVVSPVPSQPMPPVNNIQ